MFEFVHKNKKLIQIVLAIIFLPFAFFGVDVYFRDRDGGQAVAKVGNHTITPDEFGRALRERQAAIQRSMPGRIDPATLDNPALRQAILESLIQRRLVLEHATDAGVTVTSEQLKAAINEQTAFHDGNGRFSYDRYVDFLKSEGMTPAIFEARLRQDLIIRQVSDGLANTAFVPRVESQLLLEMLSQQRELSYATIAPDGYLPRVKLDAAAVKQYYADNPGEFRVPEQVRVEYVVLSSDALAQDIQVGPDEARKYYESNRRQFGNEESRTAAHILLTADPGAGPEAKQKVKARAEELYRELQKNPDGFAEAARKYSQDPGSAASGGDLGRITRGTMKDIPAFEKALFDLKPGEISPPVETQQGYHLIKAVTVNPASVKPFEQVRGQIEQELRKQLAARRFAELADKFGNTVYEQSESLKAAAELAKTAPRVSGWITREQAEPPLNNPRLLGAIFSDEVLKEKRNTEAVEVASGTLVAARVAEHKPASVQPLEEVHGALEKKLALREAARMAAEEGRRQLEALKQGKAATAAWSAPQLVSRDDPKDFPEQVLQQAFRMDVSKLPSYAGVETPRGAYLLLRITRAQKPENFPPEKAKQLDEQMRGVLAQEAIAAYVASLRQKAGVKIYKEQLEKKQ